MKHKSDDSERVFGAVLKNNLPAFSEKVFSTLNPGQTFVPSWHLDAISYQLGRVARGEIRRLIINVGPRSMKSTYVSVGYVAWVLGREPSSRFICVSYSADLTKTLHNAFRTIVSSDWFRRYFSAAEIDPRKNTETETAFLAGGYRVATSIGATLTGRGATCLIIDDPLKAEDAYSEAKRRTANEWVQKTALSRLDDKKTGTIILVMHRLHMDDMTGFLLDLSDDWTVLSLPAIAESHERVQIAANRFHDRKPGDVLSPEREPRHVLDALRRQMGTDAFMAQMQQMPIPPGGAMIKRAWIRRYASLPAIEPGGMIVQSLDTAASGGPDNDYSVITTWYFAPDERCYLLDVWRGRVNYPDLKEKVVELANLWKADQVFVEEAGTAYALIDELQYRVRGLTGVRPETDKISRMAVQSARFEAGQIFFPEQASWLFELEAELFAFPGGKHDDQVDSISQALANERTSEARMWRKLAG